MLKMISDEFGKTEQCNYHVTTSHISNLPYALAFRVRSYCYLGMERIIGREITNHVVNIP